MVHEVVFTNEPDLESMELWTKALLLANGLELPAVVEAVTAAGRHTITIE